MRRTPWLGEKRLACQEGFCSKKLGGKTNAYISINALLPCAVPILRSTYLQLGRLPQVEIPNGAVQTVCGNFRCFQKILRDSLNTAKVNFQPDTQNSYLFTYNTFIKILYMFRALPCSSSGGLRRNCIYAACGIVTLCRWLYCTPVKKELFFLNRCTGQSHRLIKFFLNRCKRQSPADSEDTRGCIYTNTT